MAEFNTTTAALRGLPSVERLVSHPDLAHLTHSSAVRVARAVIQEGREAILRGDSLGLTVEALAQQVAERSRLEEQRGVRQAINATGILLHTNLGRATLAPSAVRAVTEVAVGHASLEVDADSGGRGSRQTAVARLLCELTGAEDAFVVNNNAAATYLAIAGLAVGREVVLSRGQMVEIGGHFRLPDVIVGAGARLVEVGTTNRTRLSDYERAISSQTALLLRVHSSNYRIVGFTEEVPISELVTLGRAHGVAVADDIGSGALVDLAPFRLADEPMPQASIAAGADIVWFSGDKLLGGPQAGILIGTKQCLAPLKHHPLARAFRPDKLTLAALEATLLLYRNGDPWQEVPILRRIARSTEDILAACGRVARGLRESARGSHIDIVATESEIGGGSTPGRTLPSWAVVIDRDDIAQVARRLRYAECPVYGRMERGRFLLDLRAVEDVEESALVQAFNTVSAG